MAPCRINLPSIVLEFWFYLIKQNLSFQARALCANRKSNPGPNNGNVGFFTIISRSPLVNPNEGRSGTKRSNARRRNALQRIAEISTHNNNFFLIPTREGFRSYYGEIRTEQIDFNNTKLPTDDDIFDDELSNSIFDQNN